MNKLAMKEDVYAAFLATPAHQVSEIINGSLVTQPRPAPKHACAYSRLGIVIGSPFDMGIRGPGGWVIIDEPELHLDGHILVPDLAGWRKERLPTLPDTAWFETVPDWICEIQSPSTAQYDRGIKRDIYAKQGVKHLWLLDPEAQLLEAFELRDGAWVLLKTMAGRDEVAVAPFAAVPFSLGDLWYEEAPIEEKDEG